MIADEILHISHNLQIPLVSIGCHFDQVLAMLLVDRGRLGVQDKRHCEEALGIRR